jgi:hypothetical protein
MNHEIENVWWDFVAFKSAEEGEPIDEWWRSLPDDSDDHRGHIKDILGQLQITPPEEWEDGSDDPLFDPLIGEGGISEIRFVPAIFSVKGRFCYRIYGFMEAEELRYTFLHATNKPRRNDKDGKSTAKRRLRELIAKQATTCPIHLD